MSRKSKNFKLGTKGCNHIPSAKNIECHIDPKVINTLYSTRFANGNSLAAEWHVINFDRFCGTIKTLDLDI
jgi:hypothetical protein